VRRVRLPGPASVWRDPVHWLAFGLGAGTLPRAPGTWGTLAVLPFYFLVDDLPPWCYAALTAGLFGLGVWLCGRTARDLGVHDHPGIVWDEMVGFLAAMLLVRGGWWPLAGFLLFRFFDIVKPWPIRAVDRRLGGGWGIMLDDLLAGLYAALLLWLGARYLAGG